ncbi:MAG: monovalent cation/H(+) antiporter subunit G [Tomitella sp.]|nr:monovalent cation/H(+) antiporter subunit G [Tomitella sp.]
MTAVLDWISAFLVLAGSLFAFTAAVGMVRFPDTISRMHPSTKTQVFGLVLVLIGAGIRLRGSVDVGMLVLAGLFTVIVSPVFAHLVGRTAYRERGLRKDLMTRDEMPPTPPDADDPVDPDSLDDTADTAETDEI